MRIYATLGSVGGGFAHSSGDEANLAATDCRRLSSPGFLHKFNIREVVVQHGCQLLQALALFVQELHRPSGSIEAAPHVSR